MDFWNFWLPLIILGVVCVLLWLNEHMKSRAKTQAKKRREQERILLKFATCHYPPLDVWHLTDNAFRTTNVINTRKTLEEMMKADLIAPPAHGERIGVPLYRLTDKGRQVADEILLRRNSVPFRQSDHYNPS